MTRDPDRLFRRYQKTRDPELLARVFDATAPRLLRLAIHLASDAAAAEDLVQTTFLAAIERADAFAGRGPVHGWLAGILAHKARDARRRGARDVDPERLFEHLHERVVPTPLEQAEQAELAGELARAIDALDDTYRQVLVLRLRHGMKAADIAHVLDLSPGAVRVRLSRGTEKLRRTLPLGLARAAFLLGTPERGLAAVREVVVAEAAKVAVLVTGTSTLTLGGLLMTKKLLLGGASLVVALAAAAWLRHPPETRPSDSSAPPTRSAALEALEAPLVVDEVPEPPANERRTEVAGDPARAALVRLRGIVNDEETGLPLPGARVDVHAPQRMTYTALKERAHAYVKQQNWRGELRTFASWPWFGGRDRFGLPSDAQRLDASELLVFDRPAERDEPLATATTDGAGRFDLPVDPAGGVLVATLDGYGRRTVPVPLPAQEWSIALRRAGLVAGHVVDEQGTRIEQAVDLLFYGQVGTGWDVNPETGEVGETDAREAWPVTTADDGSFEVQLPARAVQVDIRTPGLSMQLVLVGPHQEHVEDWVYGQSIEPGVPGTCPCGEETPVRIVARRVPVLQVIDAETGRGIEHFSMIGRELANGYARWSGRFYAPDGVYALIDDPRAQWWRALGQTPMELTLWSPGYAAHTLTLSEVPDQEVIEVRLEPGELPRLEGLLLDDGRPASGASVALQPYGRLQWGLEDEKACAFATSDGGGAFALHAPAGDYLLRVQASERVYAEPITLPDDTQRVIDLARLGQVVVQVVDSEGTPRFDHDVVLRDDSGRNDWRYSDQAGRVVFALLPDGAYQVRAPRVATHGSFGGGLAEDLVLRGGGTETVTITIPAASEPRQARVVTDLEADLSTWRARAQTGEWVDVRADGTIPVDFTELNYRHFLVAAADGRRWQADVPDDAPDGYEIRIALDGPRYEGVLLDLETDEPVRGARISAYPSGLGSRPASWPSAVTDDVGRFVLTCADDVPHRLQFHSDPERAEWDSWGNERYGFAFQTLASPSRNPEALTIRVPRMNDGGPIRMDTRKLGGRVLGATDGLPREGLRVWTTSVLPQAGGDLEIWQGGTVTTGADGAYELVVPDVPRYRVNVYGERPGSTLLAEEWERTSGGNEERDLLVP